MLREFDILIDPEFLKTWQFHWLSQIQNPQYLYTSWKARYPDAEINNLFEPPVKYIIF